MEKKATIPMPAEQAARTLEDINVRRSGFAQTAGSRLRTTRAESPRGSKALRGKALRDKAMGSKALRAAPL